ncbi:MAG TPA: TonB-dependent receptor [Chryseolinea sp.]|nr:TonB-dependent receptor [Chryseolinea sp.]
MFIFRIIIVLAILVAHIPFANGQKVTVTGTVTELGGEGIPGVNVVIKGTTNGTATDLEGRYAIAVDSGTGAVLLFSFIGYEPQEIAVRQQTKIDVQLNPNITELQEIVVTGYSSLMKKDIASSIAVVDVKDMNKIAASNFADQLQGKVAGVQIATSGEPGAFQYVRVRGIGSINNNEPLYVVDGVPVQNETNMNFINPNDIESMQVLKDASASIYGARAANGVIVITTKKGSGKTRVNFDFFTGIQDPYAFPELVTPQEKLQIDMANQEGAGLTFSSIYYIQEPDGNWTLPDFSVLSKGYPAGADEVDPERYVLNTTDPAEYPNNYPIVEANKAGTNWFKELYKPATLTNAQVSVSGGSENGTHFFSMNYFDYNGILIENKWKRIQTRLNNTFAIGKNVRVGENLNVSFQKEEGVDNFGLQYVGQAYNYPAIGPVKNINGYWAATTFSPIFIGQNPVATQARHADGYDHTDFRLTGNAFVEVDFLKGFTFKTNAGVDYYQGPTEYYAYTCPECATAGQTNRLLKNTINRKSWVVTGTLNYNRMFGKHNVYTFLGGEMRDASFEGVDLSGTGLQFGDDPNYREISNAQNYIVGSSSGSNSMLSAFFNVNYTYNEKYILAVTVRRDGSSRFLENRYGTFAGVSGAWRISLEPFMFPVDFISDLKLRASYGSSGNNEVVGGDYPGFTAYGTSKGYSSYPIDGTLVPGFGQVSSGNPDLKWETSYLTNLAIDVTIGGKFSATLEWYNRKTDDMIYGVDQPMETGNVFQVNENIGSMVNRGVDMQLSYRARSNSGNFTYNIGLTGTHYTNKVLSLDANDNTFVSGGGPTRTQQGFPVSQLYGYMAKGLWTSQQLIDYVLWADPGGVQSGAKVGRMRFEDVNRDGVINDKDRTFIGNPLPKFILGLNLDLNYKQFDLTAYVNGVFEKKTFNWHKDVIDRKKRLEEAGKTMPAYDITDNRSYDQLSSYYVEDGSFLKVRNVVLGYTIPNSTISKLGMSRARVYLQVQNPFMWTKYSGMDPDVSIVNIYQGNVAQRDLTTGVDIGRYPPTRQYIIGLNLEF